MNIVIDTNVIISALIKDGFVRNLITQLNQNLLIPEFEFMEIENHKEEILEKSGLSKKEFQILMLNLLKYIKIIKMEKILDFAEESIDIMKKIDINDAQFIATALAFNAIIWSDDKHLKKQSKIKVLNTPE